MDPEAQLGLVSRHTHTETKMIASIRNKNKFFLLLTILAGVIILFPSFNYQPRLAQGDHGRDLYAFYMTAHGATPYQDYPWFYGPLMPYYYAFIFLVFGESLRNVLIARLFLKLIIGVTIFFIMRRIVSPLWAFITTLFFWSHYAGFFHTYNHIGGILFSSLLLLMIMRYIQTLKTVDLYIGLVIIVCLSFVKLNMGLCALFGFLGCVLLTDRKSGISIQKRKMFYLSALVILPTLVFSIYFFFVSGLSKHMIQQNFPYTKIGREWPNNIARFLPELGDIITTYLQEGYWNGFLSILFMIALAGFVLRYKKIEAQKRKMLFLVIACMSSLIILFAHEFILNGINYNILWPLPFLILLVFIIVDAFLSTIPRKASLIFLIILSVIIFHKISTNLTGILEYHKPEHHLDLPRADVILRNSPEWINTVKQTVFLLENELDEQELFLALPYDPLYYFLLDRPAPTYHIVFFDFMHISPEQQRTVIEDLEQKEVNWVIYSNRIKSDEPNLGVFGQTHSQILSNYIDNKFELEKELGAWDQAPQWQENHGIQIMRRKEDRLSL